jgi:hypothetical protein
MVLGADERTLPPRTEVVRVRVEIVEDRADSGR